MSLAIQMGFATLGKRLGPQMESTEVEVEWVGLRPAQLMVKAPLRIPDGGAWILPSATIALTTIRLCGLSTIRLYGQPFLTTIIYTIYILYISNPDKTEKSGVTSHRSGNGRCKVAPTKKTWHSRRHVPLAVTTPRQKGERKKKN
jgi:hypothetical protein